GVTSLAAGVPEAALAAATTATGHDQPWIGRRRAGVSTGRACDAQLESRLAAAGSPEVARAATGARRRTDLGVDGASRRDGDRCVDVGTSARCARSNSATAGRCARGANQLDTQPVEAGG